MFMRDSLMFARSSCVHLLPCIKHMCDSGGLYADMCVECLPVLCRSSAHHTARIGTMHLDTTPPSVPISFKPKALFPFFCAEQLHTTPQMRERTSFRRDLDKQAADPTAILCKNRFPAARNFIRPQGFDDA